MPSMSFRHLPGPSLPHRTSNRCSRLYGRCLHLLAVTLPKHQRRHKPHKNSRGGQVLSPPQVMGPGVEQGIMPAAKPGATLPARQGIMPAAKPGAALPARPGTVAKARPGAGCEDSRIEGRTRLGLLQQSCLNNPRGARAVCLVAHRPLRQGGLNQLNPRRLRDGTRWPTSTNTRGGVGKRIWTVIWGPITD